MRTLNNCHLLLIPYWLIDLLKEQNKPISTLLKVNELSTILTGSDLFFYLYGSPYLLMDTLLTIQKPLNVYSQSMSPISPCDLIKDHNYDYDPKLMPLADMMVGRYCFEDTGAIDQYVRPIDGNRANLTNSIGFDLFLIDDTNNVGDPDHGEIVIGAHMFECDNDRGIPYDEESCLSRNIDLLTTHCGVSAVAQTALMQRWLNLKIK